ncbi:MAG: Asp-tRNA(Asn)/Glu-tRNA(Gln) amidotransferase subunit GatC [Patescibacteria group bacterium]
MSLTQEEVNKIAELARLELAEDEQTAFREQLSSILDYVGKLSEVPTDGVEPMTHSIPVTNVLRADEPEPCASATLDAVKAAFPESEDGLLKVKAVFE